jgi:hypothetical protein
MACDKKQKEQDTKTPMMDGGAVQLAYSAGARTAAVRAPCNALRNKCERISFLASFKQQMLALLALRSCLMTRQLHDRRSETDCNHRTASLDTGV